MKIKLHRKYLLLFVLTLSFFQLLNNNILAAGTKIVPQYGLFETTIGNDTSYANKFRDVLLNATFTSPSNKTIPFWGFFDGNGTGGTDHFDALNPKLDNGGELSGNIWKLRFMPDECGIWTFRWSFSDNSKNGEGSFLVVKEGARPGVIRKLSSNFHWFQTVDGIPIFPKVFYPVQGEQLCYDISVYGPGVYQKAIDRGYNIIMLNILPLWDWNTNQGNAFNGPMDTNFLLWYQEKPYQGEIDDGTVYDTNRMNLFAYKRLDQHIRWLADHGIVTMMFQGFAVKRTLPEYRRPSMFSDEKAEWYIKYNMARLAPYWNMIWNYTWEVDPGNGRSGWLGEQIDKLASQWEIMQDYVWGGRTDHFGKWIDKYDPWDHLYTTEALIDGNFSKDVYDISTVEIDPEKVPQYYKYKKPIFMIEDHNPLWNYHDGLEVKALDKAWSLICQGAFFGWCEFVDRGVGSARWKDMTLWSNLFSTPMSHYITILYNFIGDETNFSELAPHRELVDNGAYLLADVGKQYVVYKPNGGEFSLKIAAGSYNLTWLNPFDNVRTPQGTIDGPVQQTFITPSLMHFVLFLNSEDVTSDIP